MNERLSVNEQMIPYIGQHSSKMYMREKPSKFEYKLWVLSTSEGYPQNLHVYVGKNKNTLEEKTEIETKPLGIRMVLDFIKCIHDPPKHTFNMDIFNHLEK